MVFVPDIVRASLETSVSSILSHLTGRLLLKSSLGDRSYSASRLQTEDSFEKLQIEWRLDFIAVHFLDKVSFQLLRLVRHFNFQSWQLCSLILMQLCVRRVTVGVKRPQPIVFEEEELLFREEQIN